MYIHKKVVSAIKVLFIGGTGKISQAVSRELVKRGCQLYLLNRGSRLQEFLDKNVTFLSCDINDEDKAQSLIGDMSFDVVADFIAFTPEELERDYRLFSGKTKQFIFISSASAYQKPLAHYRVNEGTALSNPYWEYSRNKIACEEYLMKMYRQYGFPITIVRPSHTYDERSIPVGIYGAKGSWQVAIRMLEGKPVIIHGDGTSLWTLTHNSDFAKAFIGLMGNIHAIGEAVQITSDETLTWNQIYQTIADALGVKLKAVHVASELLAACSSKDYGGSLLGDKANSIVFDNAKLKRLVPGFTAATRFDQGIRQTIKYILEHPELQEIDREFDCWCDRVINALDNAVKEVKGFN